MSTTYAEGMVELHHADCLDVLRSMRDASVDAVVTDPPYGLADHAPAIVAAALAAWLTGDREHVPDGRGFMGREWDRFVPPPAVWDECWRVLKPGGHLIAFAAPRTADLMTMSIRLAGFEIRDGIDWLYASGFPKSLNVAKEIDKRRFGSDDAAAFKAALSRAVAASGKTRQQINTECGFTMRFDISFQKDPVGWGVSLPTPEQYEVICRVLNVEGDASELEALREWPRSRLERMHRVVGHEDRLNSPSGIVSAGRESTPVRREITAPGTEDARRWQGWGTALKPAREPIVMARKPLAGTVSANVLAHGTGALNIDACRVGDEQRTNNAGGASSLQRVSRVEQGYRSTVTASVGEASTVTGRWPSNVVLSHAPDCGEQCVPGCPVAELDRQSGVTRSPAGGSAQRELTSRGYKGGGLGQRRSTDHDLTEDVTKPGYADQGGASRFFPVFRYEAKAPTAERPRTPGGTAHPTVKPLDLMRWLVRLVTPPGGVVLEPFAGSGTTAEACVLEGFRCIAVERDASYLPLIEARLSKPLQPALDLFGGAA